MPITVKTKTIKMLQKANDAPYRPASTSARIFEVKIGVSGVVIKMIAESVVIERAKANIKPVKSAPLISGKVIFRKVLKPDAPSEEEASSIAGLIC